MNVIAGLLDRAAEARARVLEVKAEIQAVAGKLLELQARFEREAKGLEDQAKAKAKYIPFEQRHTLHGSSLQLVWSERHDWSPEALAALAGKYGIPLQELDACKSETGYWSVRKYEGG